MNIRVMSKRLVLVGICTLLLSIALPIAVSTVVSAHRDGCHRWHSCPSDSGSYVCGDLGYTSGCGTVVPVAPIIVAPPAPVKTSKEEVKESAIKFKTIKKFNRVEHVGYKKILTTGKAGVKATKVVVQYTDGVETTRDKPVETITQVPVDEVVEVGTRQKPTARFTKIREMKPGFMNWNKDKYIVEGFYKPNKEVILHQNSKEVGHTKTNKDGYFEFHGLKRADKPSWLMLYIKPKGKLEQVSDKTRAIFTTKELKTEYEILSKK
jgi:hypothetical protein